MLFISLIQWWYGDGWKQYAQRVLERLEGLMDYFSIALLIKTLFQPFRQIDAGTVDGSLDVRLRAFGDKLISRIIGAGIRTVIMLVGIVAIALYAVLGFAMLIVWAFVPLVPFVGIVGFAMGWGV